MSIFNPFTWFKKKPEPIQEDEYREISPGRVSEPESSWGTTEVLSTLNGMRQFITPSFRYELIPILRDLYKVNPDVSIALQDMFKLANTGHTIDFPNNTAEESTKMREHLKAATNKWSRYTGGIDGLVNKLMVQAMIGGAMSAEAVPNKELNGIETILFLKPESIVFRRYSNGVYHPYQRNPRPFTKPDKAFIKLNTETYCYVSMYNDLDEPYGVPPFLASLDSLAGQHTMRKNFKHIMELMGMLGFLEAKMAKPPREANESSQAYRIRLREMLRRMKKNLHNGMEDGLVVGFQEDHEFKFNSTSASLQNTDMIWSMNEQSVANGLGVNSSIIGLHKNNSEGGAGIQLSKMISQLKNLQMLASYALTFFYSLELRLAGFDNRGITIQFGTSTVSDDIKTQQAREYRARVNVTLYNQGIISQDQFARDMGYESPDQDKPRITVEDSNAHGTGDANTGGQKRKREEDKDDSDRKTRSKTSSNPRRGDQDSRKR